MNQQYSLEFGLTSADVAPFGVRGHAAELSDEIQGAHQGGSGRLFFHPA